MLISATVLPGHHGVRGLFAAVFSRRKQLDLPHDFVPLPYLPNSKPSAAVRSSCWAAAVSAAAGGLGLWRPELRELAQHFGWDWGRVTGFRPQEKRRGV